MWWRGDEFLSEFKASMSPRMRSAGELVVTNVRDLIATPCPQYHAGKGGHSTPGAPPYMETGALSQSYAASTFSNGPDTITATVGSSLSYALTLEMGSRSVAARPHLRRALASSIPAIVETLSGE